MEVETLLPPSVNLTMSDENNQMDVENSPEPPTSDPSDPPTEDISPATPIMMESAGGSDYGFNSEVGQSEQLGDNDEVDDEDEPVDCDDDLNADQSGYNDDGEPFPGDINDLEGMEEGPPGGDDADTGETEVERLLKKRLQPIYELVYSEQGYVTRLKFVKEKYMPIIDDDSVEVPEDLANKWRILWGNWLQLVDWHTAFLEKLERLVQEDADQIPKLFIDYRARLRTIYSKYCENHRKAALIVEQHKEYFDELRIKVSDKEDVVSHLMQPVQRIMRYQLPISEIVKYTERADLHSKAQWRKTLEIMKEIPKDTQLILEAARIDGFPGVITALGNIRIRGELQVATTTKSETKRNSFTASELKFVDRRVFLFDQMLLITEEIKPKRKDPFAQSAYQFKNAVNVNKMKFESHWSGASDDDNDHKFAITDESPGKEAVYVMDPGSVEVREHWVIQLRDMQLMQQEFLLALQDPKRFNIGGGGGGGAIGSAQPPSSGNTGKDKSHLSTERANSESNSGKKKKQKWSFTKKHRSRTDDVSSGLSVATSSQHHQRSCSVERISSSGGGGGRKESTTGDTLTVGSSASGEGHSSLKHEIRKTTSNSQGKLEEFNQQAVSPGVTTPGSSVGSGTGKKKSIFSNWFGKNKQKHSDGGS